MIDQKIRGYIMQLTLVLINDFYLDQLFEAVFEITQKDVAIFTGKQPQNVAVVLAISPSMARQTMRSA